jgi:phenylpropionate dioxygenase-like ring-hydroxylating dioxygenase large terminal subunit
MRSGGLPGYSMSEAAQTMLAGAAGPAQEARREADAGFLWDFWYPALRSSQIAGQRLATAMLLEVPLVLGRTPEGKAFAMRDSCPHRGIPLSHGHFDGKTLECSYHGWKFDACSGQCLEIPSLSSQDKLKVDRVFAGHYPCEERDGYVWVYMRSRGRTMGDNTPGARAGETSPPAPALPVFSEKYKITHLDCEMPTHVDHGIIGLMDPAHGPFVHQSWFWRSKRSIHEKEKHFEPIPYGFRMSKHQPSSNSAPYKLLRYFSGEATTTMIDFLLPNMRLEEIRSGHLWFSSRATVTPVRRDLCRIDFVAAWNVARAVPGVVPIFRAFAKEFLRQDQETMIQQSEGLKHHPHLMLIDDADRPAKWYFALKANLLESQRTGEPMVHPMNGPVTLRWRS